MQKFLRKLNSKGKYCDTCPYRVIRKESDV